MADKDKKKKKNKLKDILRRLRDHYISKADPGKGAFGVAKQLQELEAEEQAEQKKKKNKNG